MNYCPRSERVIVDKVRFDCKVLVVMSNDVTSAIDCVRVDKHKVRLKRLGVGVTTPCTWPCAVPMFIGCLSVRDLMDLLRIG